MNTPAQLAQSLAIYGRFVEDHQCPAALRELFRRAFFRTAYYAAFHCAREWAIRRGYRKPDGWGTHEGLWIAWYSTDPEMEALSQVGDSFSVQRVDADYRIELDFSLDLAIATSQLDMVFNAVKDDKHRIAGQGIAALRRNWEPPPPRYSGRPPQQGNLSL